VSQERPGQVAEYANQTEFSPELTRLHAAIADRSYLAGWNRAGNPPMWDSPKRAFADAHWRFDDARYCRIPFLATATRHCVPRSSPTR
jgi:hypothetical protein